MKEEEEALIKELEAQVKAQEEELKKIQAPPPPVPSVEISEETSMECHETMPVEPQPTEVRVYFSCNLSTRSSKLSTWPKI